MKSAGSSNDLCDKASPDTKQGMTSSKWKMRLGSLLRKGSAVDEAASLSHSEFSSA